MGERNCEISLKNVKKIQEALEENKGNSVNLQIEICLKSLVPEHRRLFETLDLHIYL
mgnify:CR=1 FL=1